MLGFPVALGTFMGSTALGVDPYLLLFEGSSPAIVAMACFYASNVAWTIIYDTIYAHQDVEDDSKAGVKSIAVRHKDSSKVLLSALAITQVALLAVTGISTGMGPVYFAGVCGGVGTSLLVMVRKVNLSEPNECMWWFKNGTWFVGGAITTGLFGEYLFKLFGLYGDHQSSLEVAEMKLASKSL